METTRGCRLQPAHQSLYGLEGELVMIRITTEPRSLEDALEALASLNFPVNPELIHRPGSVTIEFPAYENHVDVVRRELDRQSVTVQAMDVFSVLSLPEFVPN